MVTLVASYFYPPSRELEPRIDFLVEAERAVKENRLIQPESDSALFYYREILNQQPDNPEATAGIKQLTTIYAEKAQREIDRLKYKSAREYVRLGLLVAPDDERLLKLEREANLLKAPGQVVGSLISSFKKGFRSVE